MQNIDREFFIKLRERLPSKYAAILFRRYQQKKVKISRVVMKWTGHNDYKSMKPYIKIVDELKVENMKKFDLK